MPACAVDAVRQMRTLMQSASLKCSILHADSISKSCSLESVRKQSLALREAPVMSLTHQGELAAHGHPAGDQQG